MRVLRLAMSFWHCELHGYMSEPWTEADGTHVCSMYGDHASCGLTVEGPFVFERATSLAFDEERRDG